MDRSGLEGTLVVGFTDDGKCIMNGNVMRLALEYSKMLNVPIMSHAEDYNLAGSGCAPPPPKA